MSRLLVHLVTGPSDTTRGALGFLVASTAAAAGHDVTLFLAGDAVAYLRDPIMDAAQGIGTGSVREHFTALTAAGGRVYGSGLSAKARGMTPEAIGGKAELVPPDRLIELIFEADQVVTY